MTRYIIRDFEGSEKYENSIPYKWKMFDDHSLSNELIKALLSYKDEIDYNSLLVFIDTTKRKYKCEIEYETKFIHIHYYFNKRYVTKNINDDDDNVESYIVLLFNKYNEFKIIDLSSISLYNINKIISYSEARINADYNTKIILFNLGAFTFMIDFNYSPVHKTPYCYFKNNNDDSFSYYINTERYHEFPDGLIEFVSKTQPRISCVPKPINYKWNHYMLQYNEPFYTAVIQYCMEHIDEIKADAGIPVTPQPVFNITYISRNECNKKSKERRRAELLEELKKLDEET